MRISMSSGEYNIIDCGQVFLFGEEQELKMDINVDEKFNCSIIFKFQNDESGITNVKCSIMSDTIVLCCQNFEDLGTGFSKPWSIAKVNGKELYLMFWSYLEGKEETGRVRSIKYTIYSEK